MKKALIYAGLLVVIAMGAGGIAYVQLDRSPGEIIRYTERRLIGHPNLEAVLLPLLARWRLLVERPITSPVPSYGKGQQAESLPPQRYSPEGTPLATQKLKGWSKNDVLNPDRLLSSMAEIEAALHTAVPGQILEIAPGHYPMTKTIRVRSGGLADRPIILRARAPGQVVIESTASEGFYSQHPYWVFENLVIRGRCGEHSNCEHAFHIVGQARNTVIRNNHIEDFNAQIKVNGLNQHWPDHGLIQFNTLVNSKPRLTANPVTPVDIVGASSWQVADNQVRHFIKGDGNKTSYGIFIKGGGENGRIERNLIVCTNQDISQAGERVGLSFGGGGTGLESCRDKRCITEHSKGLAANNIIAHCNDFGIYINKANQTLVAHNTLQNTYGIDTRFAASSATIVGNIVDGTIRARDNASITATHNDRPSFPWKNLVPDENEIKDDFCGTKRTFPTPAGSLILPSECTQ